MRGRPARSKTVHLAAPVGGINRIDPASEMPASDAVFLYNVIAAEYGLRSRLGFHEWVTGMTGTSDNTVRSVLPFKGSKSAGSTDRLFAAMDNGLWDVSNSTASPTAPAGVTAFGTSNGDAGFGAALTCPDANGNHNLLYTDEANGYFVYREATSDWLKPTQGAGATQVNNVDPASFVHVCLFAHRLWFTAKDSTKAWYLGAFGSPAIYGSATAFDFGPYFPHGGALVGLYNWTTDGANGVGNMLVAISAGGDIVIFQGTDPSSASSWSMVAVWYAGGLPAGRRIATDFGGDLLILTTVGILPLSKLVIGNPIVDRTVYATGKIANLFNAAMVTSSSLRGWSVRLHPQDNTLLVTVPTAAGQPTTQLAMSLANRSWSQYRGLNMLSNEVWNGQMYFGTTDGRICLHTDYIDGVLLSDPNAYTPIDCSILSSFQNLGIPNQKRVGLIRPKFLADGTQPANSSSAKYNYDLSEIAAPGGNPTASSATWGSAVWGTSQWAGDYASTQPVGGSAGIGVDVAIATRFAAVSRTVLAGWDVSFDLGGFL